MYKQSINDKIIELADASVKRYQPEKLAWMWGEALFTWSLYLLDNELGEDRYFWFYKKYVDTHIEKGYRVDQSDTSAPGLTAYALYLKTGDPKYKLVVDRVVNYMKTTPKVLDYMPNHLGTSPESWFYPKSVWVDSVMMYGVFTSWYGKTANDSDLYDFAVKQPALFAKYLQDPDDKLFYHSYWANWKITYPKRKFFWGRGNGWVIAGLPKVINNLPKESLESENAISILKETSEALLTYQKEDGFFETVLNKPGKTYIENSATALIAAGWLEGVHHGYLDTKFADAGIKALEAVVGSLTTKNGLSSMPFISMPTIPTPPSPYLAYKITPRQNDWHYGLAALFIALINYRQLKK
ncbi:MAG: glycoside hydrolase family 88 protein [Prolixibacteraceae bacterium]